MKVRGALAALVLTGCPGPEPEPGEGLEPATWRTAVETDPSVGAFLSVWGPSPDEVWAVGGQLAALDDAGVGAAYRRDGGSWAPVSLPADTPLLNWVHGTASRVWVVGNAGVALYREADAWVSTDTTIDEPLWGVWVSGDDDVWAVGGDALDPDAKPVAVHWDGAAWSSSALPMLDRDASALFKVWGAAPDDVWAVGDAGIILHHDGQAWSQVPSGTGNDLISLWGTGPDEILAVGGRTIGTMARWDGSAWTIQEEGRIPGLNGTWMSGGGDAAMVGNLGSAALLPREGFDIEQEDSGAGILVLHGVYGFADGSRIAVGGSLDRSPPYLGIIIETE